MAETLKLTDGTTNVSLISTSGLNILYDGYVQQTSSPRSIWRSSMFSEGRSLISQTAANVTEEFQLVLNATSDDNAASQIQTLVRLARKAQQYHTTNWQQTPVYLQAQLSSETGIRYALVYDVQIRFNHSFHTIPFEDQHKTPEVSIIVEREPYWRGTAFGSTPTSITTTAPDRPATALSYSWKVIGNYRATTGIEYVFNYDISLGTNSANLVATSPVTFFEVANTPAADDCVYFGGSDPFHIIPFHITTAGDAEDVVLAFEYWDGAAWQDIGYHTPSWSFIFGNTNSNAICFAGEDDWAVANLFGANVYWVRLRIDSLTSWTTSPVMTGQHFYCAQDNYIEWADTQIDGDMTAKGILRFVCGHRDTYGADTIYMGTKSRGLTNFISQFLPIDGYNGDWAVSYNGDTAASDDPRAGADGQVALTDFTTTTDMAERVTFTINEGGGGDKDKISDFEGVYNVFLVAEQQNGSAGDVNVKVRMHILNTDWDTDTVTMTMADDGPELINLGRLTMFPTGLQHAENSYYVMNFDIMAESNNGTTPDLAIFSMVLIPIDEWASVAAVDFDTMPLSSWTETIIEMDNGVYRDASTMRRRYGADDYIISYWETRGGLPEFEPSRQTRLYALMSDQGHAYTSLYFGIGVYPLERWSYLRGAD